MGRAAWWTVIGLAGLVVLPSLWVRLRSIGRVRTAGTVPPSQFALVLGAGVRRDGRPSRILHGRLVVARALYQRGKVRRLLVSGSPSSRGHSEPGVMRDYLVAHGVPSDHVLVDETGVNTWRSCLAAAHLYHLDQTTVVTTNFHLRRSIWLCRRVGINAYGVGHDSRAEGLPIVTAKGFVREVLATIKAFWRPLWAKR